MARERDGGNGEQGTGNRERGTENRDSDVRRVVLRGGRVVIDARAGELTTKQVLAEVGS